MKPRKMTEQPGYVPDLIRADGDPTRKHCEEVDEVKIERLPRFLLTEISFRYPITPLPRGEEHYQQAATILKSSQFWLR